jgi:hypothetical protein
MSIITLLVIIIMLFAIAGVVGYFGYDYLKYKNQMEEDLKEKSEEITSNKNKISEEEKTRLSNLAYIVDQINDINTDIYDEVTSNMASNEALQASLEESSSTFQKNHEDLLNSLNTLFEFSVNDAGVNRQIELIDLPGSVAPSMKLLTDITIQNSVTMSNISNTNPFHICANDRCIRFPDDNGDVKITNLTEGKNIVFDTVGDGSKAIFSGPNSVEMNNGLKIAGGNMIIGDNSIIRSETPENPVTVQDQICLKDATETTCLTAADLKSLIALNAAAPQTNNNEANNSSEIITPGE